MPEIGEIARAEKTGINASRGRALFIFVECPDCHIRRWRAYLKSTARGISRCCHCEQQRRLRPLTDVFWNQVEKGNHNGCWVWIGALDTLGYGHLTIKRKLRLAHRVSWELANGSIPDGLHVLHHCDNPPCVNPSHLFLGTHLDNMRDMIAKGRSNFNHSKPTISISRQRRTLLDKLSSPTRDQDNNRTLAPHDSRRSTLSPNLPHEIPSS